MKYQRNAVEKLHVILKNGGQIYMKCKFKLFSNDWLYHY